MQSDEFVGGRVADLVEPAKSFGSTEPITRVIGYLRESKEYDAIIEDGNRASIVSVRDLLDVENITSQKLSKVMKQVPKVNIQDKVSRAAKVMFDYRIKLLPVFDGKKFVGKITSPAIAKVLVDSDHYGESIARIATPHPIWVYASDSVAKAKRLMLDRRIDQLPILSEKRLTGMITSDTIISRILPSTDRNVKGNKQIGRMKMQVNLLSQPWIITNEVTDSLGETLKTMLKAGSNYSVILSADEVQGIVTYRDFMKLLPNLELLEEVPISIVGLPDDILQSEAAKQKFYASVKLLLRAWPSLSEARAIIKSGETKAPKKRYQVQVFIGSENFHYNYTISSYDLAKAFEEVEMWIKKLAMRHGRKIVIGKRRESNRKLILP